MQKVQFRKRKMTENTLVYHHVLLTDQPHNLTTIIGDYKFSGIVWVAGEPSPVITPQTLIYLFGNDVERLRSLIGDIENAGIIVVDGNAQKIADGLPLLVHGVGLLIRGLFQKSDYFKRLTESHQFQSLTESNKNTPAYRKGIYITNVEQCGDEVAFNLLRCSTNLDGPTDNFREVDREIIQQVQTVVDHFFEQKTECNHVLAQIYYNKVKKARIASHSDKTKDMPRNGVIAFCTFYDNEGAIKTPMALTRLRFRLKSEAALHNPDLKKLFDVVLEPNSVFVIPLSTNRLYTHEIVPSALESKFLPTRLGYVIRCSDTRAVYRENQTYIVGDDNIFHPLRPICEEDRVQLKDLYARENLSIDIVEYGDIYFSMNEGDYKRPLL